MRPGDVLSRVFDKPLAIMSTSSYRAEAGTIQGRLDMAKYITHAQGRAGRRVCCWSTTWPTRASRCARVVDRLRGMPSISELRSAVLWTKGVSTYTPDYYVELLPTSPWIHQPFEEYDDLRPDGLAKKFVDLKHRMRKAATRHKARAAALPSLLSSLVPRKGLEPPRSYPLVPETSASTNSATWASQASHGLYHQSNNIQDHAAPSAPS